MFAPDESDDLILEIGVDGVLGYQDIALTGVIDQVLQGFMKPYGLLGCRFLGRRLLKNMDVRVQPIRQRQGVIDAFEIGGTGPDGDEDFFLVHGWRPPSFQFYKACAIIIIANNYSNIDGNAPIPATEMFQCETFRRSSRDRLIVVWENNRWVS